MSDNVESGDCGKGGPIFRTTDTGVPGSVLHTPHTILAVGSDVIGAVQLVDEAGAAYGVKHVANKPRVSSMPYTYDVAEGNLSGHSVLRKFGRNGVVGTATETVWEYSSLMSYSVSAETMYLMSSATGDDQDYTVYGLDGDWAEQSEVVTCNGQTPVAITGTWLRVSRVTNDGVTNNAGDIYVSNDGTNVTAGVPDTAADVRAMVAIGLNQTLQAAWTVPAGKTLYLTDYWVSESSNKGAEVTLVVRPFGGVFRVKDTQQTLSNAIHVPFTFPQLVDAKSDIEVRTNGVGIGAIISAGFSGWYE